jgi:hypothetical protein
MSLRERLLRDNGDFQSVIGTREGARVIAGLIDYCGLFEPNAAGNLYEEGRRDVGLLLYKRTLGTPGGERAYIAARDERLELMLKEEDGNHA